MFTITCVSCKTAQTYKTNGSAQQVRFMEFVGYNHFINFKSLAAMLQSHLHAQSSPTQQIPWSRYFLYIRESLKHVWHCKYANLIQISWITINQLLPDSVVYFTVLALTFAVRLVTSLPALAW